MEYTPVYSGKVREIYDLSDGRLVIVTTDRISAFDSILPVPVDGKGIILNQLSNFWFRRTRAIVPNHIMDDRLEAMPSFFQKEYFRDRTVLVEKLDMLPFEFVVRGYLFGSMWNAYQKGEDFCGIRLRGSYDLAQRLEQPVLTPARKHDIGHDEYISMQEAASFLGAETAEHIQKICMELYQTCSAYALSKGLIIADAKFEFGRNARGELVLADEIFTPDSSRYWGADRHKAGQEPPSFDKQFLRNWLTAHRTADGFPFGEVPVHVLRQTKSLYEECFHRLTDDRP